MATTSRNAKRTEPATGWTDDEMAAMRERAREVKAVGRRSGKAGAADAERDLLAKIAEMPDSDRVMAERIHALVTEHAPQLAPRTWYGMPAWARDGKVICYFTSAAKFKSRYATLGFSDDARLDDGTMWPTSFGITKLTAADEKRIVELVKKAVG